MYPKVYQIDFVGRRRGVVGVFEKFTNYVVAMSPEEAIWRLEEEYDHIQQPKTKESFMLNEGGK